MTLLGLKLRQTQQLNQGLQQSLRVLQMSGLELEREVGDWLQDNPLLERREPAEEGRFEPTTCRPPFPAATKSAAKMPKTFGRPSPTKKISNATCTTKCANTR